MASSPGLFPPSYAATQTAGLSFAPSPCRVEKAMLFLVRIEARKSLSQLTVNSEGVLKGNPQGARAGSSLALQE